MSKGFSLYQILILLILSMIAFATHSSVSGKDGLLKVYFFDVGQGDSIFIESPNGNQILIDGGPDNTVVQKLAQVMSIYDREIDIVILTHAHADHVTGLVEVLKRYEVKNILFTKAFYDTGEYRSWLDAVGEEGAIVFEAKAGSYIDLGNDAKINIIFPLNSLDGITTSSPNSLSVGALLTYGEFEALFTGDLGVKEERSIIANNIDIDVDVLKVGHQGSKTSSSAEFLSAVSPQVGVISVGASNRYGHPHPEVIDRLESFGIEYYRTDYDGDVKIMTDGNNYSVVKY